MKKSHLALGLTLMAGLALITGWGCGSSPSSPSAPTVTPTPSAPTPTPTATVDIKWAYAEIYSTNSYPFAFVELQVNGSPVTDAAVTLSGTFSGAPVTASYQNPTTFSGQHFAIYQFPAFTYTPNKTYILSTTALGKTASVTVTSPGNLSLSLDANGAVTLANAGVTGNADYVIVRDNPYTTTTLDVEYPAFPVTIAPPPGIAYPGSTGTIYNVAARAEYDTTAVSNATVTFGMVELWEEKDQPVTIP